MAMTPIDQIIRQLCRETGEPDYKNYDTILSHVRGVLVDLNLYVLPGVKTVILTANHLKNLDWPCSCVKPLLVGLIRKGKTCTLSVDSSIASSTSCSCNSISDAENDVEDIINSEGDGLDVYYYDGSEIKGYGNGYDNVNICTHDKENRLTNVKCRIRPGDKFQFTFVTDGISDGVTHVPVECETAIGEWVFWKYYRRTNPGLSADGRKNYKEEFTRLRKFYNDPSIDDWIRAIVRR